MQETSLMNNLVIRKMPRSVLSDMNRSSETVKNHLKNLHLKDPTAINNMEQDETPIELNEELL